MRQCTCKELTDATRQRYEVAIAEKNAEIDRLIQVLCRIAALSGRLKMASEAASEAIEIANRVR